MGAYRICGGVLVGRAATRLSRRHPKIVPLVGSPGQEECVDAGLGRHPDGREAQGFFRVPIV